MRRNNAEHIGKLVNQFLRQEGLETPLYEQRLINSWSEVLGATITSYTKDLYLRNQTLYVHLTSAVLRQELMMGREALIRHLNERVGAMVITKIVFR
jgi:predicted nucleic acid-binding Zn ribbon protein